MTPVTKQILSHNKRLFRCASHPIPDSIARDCHCVFAVFSLRTIFNRMCMAARSVVSFDLFVFAAGATGRVNGMSGYAVGNATKAVTGPAERCFDHCSVIHAPDRVEIQLQQIATAVSSTQC